MDHGVVTGDWRQHITNNNNNKIIRIIIKELGKETRRKKKNEAGKGVIFGSILRWLLWQRKKKKKDIYLYTGKGRRVGGGWASPTALCHHPALG